MARRRRSIANGKNKDAKNKESNVSTETEVQDEEIRAPSAKGSTSSDCSATPTETQSSEGGVGKTGTEQHNSDPSKDELMPLDIQQMILGDLQSVGRGGEEIIVSRESGGDTSGDNMEDMSGEAGNLAESPREEVYEIHVEEDDEDELIIMNEDDEDGEENQYVIVVNSDFEVTDETTQEVVSIHNLSDLPEGSCEIITVVRESDYDSSQESLDGIEEEGCDNINAVIGTMDGIHRVHIYSDDESSNHEDSSKEEIIVTEHESDVNSFSQMANELSQNIELPEVSEPTCSSKNNEPGTFDIKDQSLKVASIHEEHNSEVVSDEINSDHEGEIIKNSFEITPETQKITAEELDIETEMNGLEASKESCQDEHIIENDNSLREELNENKEKIETEVNSEVMDETSEANSKKVIKETFSSSQNIETTEESEKCKSPETSKRQNSLNKNDRPMENKQTINLDKNVGSSKHDLENETTIDSIKSFLAASPVKLEEHSESLQEHKVTSNSRVSESVKDESSEMTDCVNVEMCKTEKTNKSHFNFFGVQSRDYKVEDKAESVKEEAISKEEEDKQTFRSRSGSTDTTGSESGSNSGSGRRRSGRIRSFGGSKHEFDGSKSGHGSAATVSTTTPPVPGYELDKPVKVKSRWRRSSELEMGCSNRRQHELEVMAANARLMDSDNTSTPPHRSGQPSTPPDTPPPDKDVEDILGNFEQLDCNEYHTDRSRSKEAKRMVCDCMLTKEEIARGDMGCGEDCLNRLLMIECGARCMLGERCANKRFQNLEYAKCEVFKTEMKGFGLKALEDIPIDTFLLEYVGEVLDPKEFRRRAKDYAKDKNQHYYFMALKSDAIIDATQKGNISRFINHSCDPNSETQKWTVNGELRVGFFSKRAISAGEEITFDYQLQRYGKEAQRCYCKTSSCRGWIGEDPEKENKWSDLSGRNKERRERERKKKEDKRNVKDILNDIDLEEEIEKLVLKNRAQTLMLCRLMVRAEDHSSRVQLLRILQTGETACLRLFLDYHGLRLIWSWMMDPASSSSLKIEILETLVKLPIPNKTMLQDSKVLSMVEKWSTTALTVADAKDRSSTEDESDKGDSDKDKHAKGSDSEKGSDDSNTNKPVETEEQQEINKKKIIEIANTLLKEWATLKEVFRIPKRERIEQMKEHEREADKVCRGSSVEKQDKSYDRHRSQDKYRNEYDRRDRDREKDRDRDKDKDRKRGRDSPDSDKSARKSAKADDRQSHLTKMERRQLFAIKAAQEEEDRQRRQQENIWQEQVQLAAHELVAQAQANNYPYPPPQQWMPFPPGPDPNMMPPQHMDPQQMFGGMNHGNPPPPFRFNQPGPLHQHPPFLDPNHNPPFHNPVNPMFNHPPPLPKQPLLPTPNQPLLPTPPLPNQPLLPSPNQHLLPTPPLPSQPFIPNQTNQPPRPFMANQPPQPFMPNQPNQPPQPFMPNQPPQSFMPNQAPQPFMPNQPNHPPMLPNPPLPNQPHPLNLPPFTTQPPLPIQPPPMVTSQTPPVTSIVFPPEPKVTQHFQNPQNQFSQPPPFTSQPPLPSLPPTPSPRPVLQNQLPTPFPQTTVVPVTSTVSSAPVPVLLPTPVRLPPKWKSAKDATGRTYYYHVKTRVSQWEPPLWDYQQQQAVQESESESESSDSEEEESSSEEEEPQEEEKMEEEEYEPAEEVSFDEDLGCEELGDSPYEPETMELLEDIMEDTKKKRKDPLVQERIISPRTADEIPDKLDKRKIRELKEKLRRQKAKEKQRLKQKSKSKGRGATSKCEADTSSDPGRKIKDAFRLNMAGVIVHYLNAYRKPDCKFGKITNTEDFKHLARKLTHFVMLKELKHCRSVDDLECNDNVKHKARDFIKKYMAKFGPVYQRPCDDD